MKVYFPGALLQSQQAVTWEINKDELRLILNI